MKQTIRRISIIFFLLFTIFNSSISRANTGDTIVVQGFNHLLHQNCNVGDSTYLFPADSLSFYKILLRYELSCPPGGCDIYDRIATLKVMHHSGEFDSTLTLAPSFTVNGNSVDTLQYMNDTSYSYTYDTLTQQIDSTPLNPLHIVEYNDSLNPQVATDSFYVWPAYYNQYIFDSTGTATDSVFVNPDSTLYLTNDSVYHTFEVIQPYEIARAITPYGEGVVLWFDVSDYRMLLHDSVELNSRACGYSNGWQVTTTFYYIEGIPPLHPYKIFNLWNGTWPYGNSSNPINNHLQPITLQLDPQTVYEKLRVITTGHGFGCSPNQNVAEFYDVTHSVIINGTSLPQHLWRSDCGSNPLYPQGAPGYTSTWFYKRANWCPGSYVKPHDYNATKYLGSGDTLRVDVNMAAYNVSSCPSGAYAPEYYIQSHAFYYDDIHYIHDAAILEVLKPNDKFEYNRMNPICDAYSPVVVIKNYGRDSLTSLTLHYGVDGNYSNTYTWTGLLRLTDTALVSIPSVSFSAGSHTFGVYIDQPNGAADEFTYDDTLHTTFTATNYYGTNYIFYQLSTDNSPGQSSVKVRNENDSIVYSRNNFTMAGHTYIDTIMLPNGCYKYTISDSYGDGICCYNGTGSLRLFRGGSSNPVVLTGDYGDFYSWNFTLDDHTGINEYNLTNRIFAYPNPASDRLTLNTSFEFGKVMIDIIDVTGRKVCAAISKEVIGNFTQIDLPNVPDGMYYVKVQKQGETYTTKVFISQGR